MDEIDKLPSPDQSLGHGMDKFFSQIVTLTNHSMDDIILKQASDAIYLTIIKGFKKNIQIAAMRGFTQAYLCVYETNAKYRDYIPIDAFIHMSPNMQELFKRAHIEPVMDRVRKTLLPFLVDIQVVEPLTPVPVSDSDVESDVESVTSVDEKIKLIAIVAHWPRRKEQPNNNSVPV